MKRTLTLFGLSLMFLAVAAFAQKPMDEASEKNVKTHAGPDHHQHYRQFGHYQLDHELRRRKPRTLSRGGKQQRLEVGLPSGRRDEPLSATHRAGAGKTYEWQILTRDGDLRTAGTVPVGSHG